MQKGSRLVYTSTMALKLLLSLLVVMEIAAFILAIYLQRRKTCAAVSRSLAYAAILALAALSLFIQISFLLGAPGLYVLADLAVIAFSAYQLIRNRVTLRADAARMRYFYEANRGLFLLLTPLIAYLFAQAFLASPNNGDSMVYNLARVLMFRNESSLFLQNFSTPQQAVFPIGHDLLSFVFLRFHSDFGLAVFSFIDYLVVVAGTYSLVASYFGRKWGTTVALLIASLTGLVLQATTTKNDIPCAAAAVVVLLAGRHFLLRRESTDLAMLAVGLLWGFSIKTYFAAFALPFMLLYVLLFVRTHSLSGLRQIASVQRIRPGYAIILPFGLLVCMVFFYGGNMKRFSSAFGDKPFVDQHRNRDGLAGGAINAGRYLLQAAEVPTRFAPLLRKAHDRLLGKNRFKGMRDRHDASGMSFAASFVSEDYSWYGPLGLFLVFPCIVWAAVFGSGYIRLGSLALLIYFLAVAFQIAWMPWNGRFFSLFFAASGLSVAYTLSRFRSGRQRIIRGLVIVLAVYGLLSATLQNNLKMTIPPYGSVNLVYNLCRLGVDVAGGRPLPGGWQPWIGTVTDRASGYRRFFPPGLFDTFCHTLERNRRVLIMGHFIPVFPLLFSRPDLDVTVSRLSRVVVDGCEYDLAAPADYAVVRARYDYVVILTKDVREFGMYEWLRREEMPYYSKSGAIFLLRR